MLVEKFVSSIFFLYSMFSHCYELQQGQKAVRRVMLITLSLHLEGFKHTIIGLHRNFLIIEMKSSEKQQQCTDGNNLHIGEYLRAGNKAYQNLMLRQWQEEKESWIKDELTPGSKPEEKPLPFILLFLFKHKDFESFTLHPECCETLGNLTGAGEKMDVLC